MNVSTTRRRVELSYVAINGPLLPDIFRYMIRINIDEIIIDVLFRLFIFVFINCDRPIM